MDKKPPVIVGLAIVPPSPVFGQSVTANYSCTDGGSGVALCGPSGSPVITPAVGNTGPLSSPADGSVGAHTFTVYSQDAVNNQSTVSQVSYSVGQATPVLIWTTPAAITYGTALSALQLNASASVAGTFLYNPPVGAVLTAGPHTLSVTFNPTDSADYATATTSVQLMVNQAASVLSWAAPAPINLGTPLSSTQLNATASVPGTFVYTPPAGAMLPAGNQVLSVAFIPTDALDYLPASKQVPLLVTQPLISFSPPSLNFGSVKLGTSPSITVVVSNLGNGPLVVNKISFPAGVDDNDLFTITNNCTRKVLPNGTCSFVVTFSAQELGRCDRTLFVRDNVAGSPQQVPISVKVVK